MAEGKGPGLITPPIRDPSQLDISVSLPHSERGLGVSTQRQAQQRCRQKCNVRHEAEDLSLSAMWVCVRGKTAVFFFAVQVSELATIEPDTGIPNP